MEDSRLPEFMAQAETAYNTALEALNDVVSWQTIKNGANSYASKRSTASGLAVFKFEGFIEKEAQAVVKYFRENYTRMNAEYNAALFDSQTVVKVFNETSKLIHEVTRSPVLGVAARDVVYFDILLTLDETTFAIVDVSVEAEEVSPRDKCVRVDLKYSLHIFEQMQGNTPKTHLTHIALGDPKGSIPASFVNLSLTSRAGFYERMIERMASDIS